MKFRLVIIFAVLSLLLGGIAGGYIAISKGIPSIEELKQYNQAAGTRIYADDDVLIGELKIEKGIFVSLDRMPKNIVNAIVAVEDSRFWKHKGIDYIAIARAVVKDIIHASLKEGGSTLTQQLAKVVFLSPEKTVKRKLMEASLAIQIENNLSKKEILELYLNKVYFGHGAYGVEMASKVYFGKSVNHLTLAEASLIAGLVKAPTLYSPFNDLSRAKDRQAIVLARMEEEGYINKSERTTAFAQPLYLASPKKGIEANSYFIDYIKKYLEEKYGLDTVYKGGMKVYTTLNRGMQSSAVAAVQAGLKDVDKRRGWRGPLERKKDVDFEKELKAKELTGTVAINPGDIYSGLVLKVSDKEAFIKTRGVVGRLAIKDAMWASRTIMKEGAAKTIQNFSLSKILRPGDVIKVSIKSIQNKNIQLALEQDPEVEGALVSVEPYTGFIRAMVGGYDFTRSDFNRAILAKRQPGSAFKPVIYAAAMDNGFTPASIINDEPASYVGGLKGEWNPENYDHKFYGPTRLREALAYSRNVVTVKLVDSMGIDNLINFARTVGFDGEIPRNLSIALGSLNITPFQLALVYDVFASNGMKVRPISIKYITDRKGRVLESNEPNPEQTISPQTSFLITSMMQDVIKYGTGWRAKALGVPVAGKTGTTNDYKDAWFVGYSSGLVSCVWVGFDSFKTLGSLETGARAASPIWVSFMQNALHGNSEGFSQPEGIVTAVIDPKTGLLSRDESGIREFFKDGSQPKQLSPSKSIWEVKEPQQIDFD
ncbi:Penicillin-binding protein 1 [Candidatus Sulfobium mesophilum]|uniref:Penicillin-binding protein 1A n=1 Tax=Candidatus Sulfobium mesophilum TaxID=2016548 RepID=A0A2U3QGU8_9BACT|nr:Penicillin-binding protein 1 [Candidatus Sulfobium mesophilum]